MLVLQNILLLVIDGMTNCKSCFYCAQCTSAVSSMFVGGCGFCRVWSSA